MDIFIQNKYTKWYFSIVENAKSQNRKKKNGVYYEAHHIIPKCIIKNNDLVLLTAKEHYICHLLLTKMCINPKHKMKMAYALWRFILRGNKYHEKIKISSKIYEWCRTEQAKITSEKLKGKFCPAQGWNKGLTHSNETRKRISEGRKGIKTGPRPNIRELALSKKGLPTKKVKCPVCGTFGGENIMKRWHFDKCKKKAGDKPPLLKMI